MRTACPTRNFKNFLLVRGFLRLIFSLFSFFFDFSCFLLGLGFGGIETFDVFFIYCFYNFLFERRRFGKALWASSKTALAEAPPAPPGDPLGPLGLFKAPGASAGCEPFLLCGVSHGESGRG